MINRASQRGQKLKNPTTKGAKGFVLPFTVVLTLILSTGAAFWYRQATVTSFLATRLLEQRADYLECGSMIPFVKKELDTLSEEELNHSENEFMSVVVGSEARWTIDRSDLSQGKIWLTFKKKVTPVAELKLAVPFSVGG